MRTDKISKTGDFQDAGSPVSYVAYFYDLNFRESLDIVEEQDYVRRIVGRIPYSAQETEHAMEEIERALTAYVQTHGRN